MLRQVSTEISETSLELHIPSYPGSPRSVSLVLSGSSTESHESNAENKISMNTVVNFIHEDNPFLLAAETGNVEMIKLFLRHKTTSQQVHQMDLLGRTALHLAVMANNETVIELLLKSGIDPNIEDSLGMTPLSICLMRNPSLRIANMLFEYHAVLVPRADPMDTGLLLQFVMMCQPTSEEEKILGLLIEKGGKLNDLNAPGGRQPLHFAAMSNNCRLITVLVDLGADRHLVNHRNQTPRDVALAFGAKEASDLLETLDNESLISMVTTMSGIVRE